MRIYIWMVSYKVLDIPLGKKTVLLWAITQWVMVFPYRCFRTYQSHLQASLEPWRWDWQVVTKRWQWITTTCRVIVQGEHDSHLFHRRSLELCICLGRWPHLLMNKVVVVSVKSCNLLCKTYTILCQLYQNRRSVLTN